MMDLNAVAKRIESEVVGVQSARAWTRVSGKERIYIDLTKRNGGAHWNGGRGATMVVHADGRLGDPTDWAGAATEQYHVDHKTVSQIAAIVAESAAS